MRSKYAAMLTVCALALAVCAVGAASALAAEAPEWYSAAPEWQQGGAALSKAATTKSKGKVKLIDEKMDAELECESAGEGSVGPGAVDKTTGWALSGCVPTPKAESTQGKEVTNLCVKAEASTVVGLPWHTELVYSDGALRDAIVSEGKEKPGFTLKCENALGTKETDTCIAEKLNTTVTGATGGVDSAFDGEKLNCSLGGAEVGKLVSTQLVEAAKGATLEATAGFKKLTSSLEVKGTGELTVEDTGWAKIGFQCPVEVAGTAGAGGKGAITSYKVTGSCVSNQCTQLVESGPDRLPWDTELYESGGVIRDRILSGGSGEPAWTFVCENSIGNRESDTCSLAVSPALENTGPGGDVAIFDEQLTKGPCSLGGNEKGVWKGELKLKPSSGSGAIVAKT